METLEDAQRYVASNIFEGAECPCCHQEAKVQPHYFHKTLAESLFWIFFASSKVHTKHGAINVSKTLSSLQIKNSSSYSKLEYWGLISNEGVAKGYWRITTEGKSFLEGTHSIMSKALTYNGSVISYSGNKIKITNSIEDFDLTERLQNSVHKVNFL